VTLIWQSALGFSMFYLCAWLLSAARSKIAWRTVLLALGMQILIGLIFYKFPYFQQITLAFNEALSGIARATEAGTSLLFGYLGGAPSPFKLEPGGNNFVLAIQTLPVVVVISALTSLLFHWRILPMVVRVFSWALTRSCGIGGALGLSSAANIFLGPVESPMFVKPYLAKLSQGELFAVMVGGMAGIAGTMMVLYGIVLQPAVPGAIGHILIASLMSAPASIAISALMQPHEGPHTSALVVQEDSAQSAMDAIARGTVEGMQMLINIIAMVLVLTALIALLNQLLSWVSGSQTLSVQGILGVLMAPCAWLVGVPASEAQVAGQLIGTKTVLNEYLAYVNLTQLAPGALSERSRVLMTYALCGFANFGSLGIMIGGLGTLCPERRGDIIQLGYRCLIGGTLCTLSGAAVIGVLY
jgi:concentrative nucleoside transporter, CNT family